METLAPVVVPKHAFLTGAFSSCSSLNQRWEWIFFCLPSANLFKRLQDHHWFDVLMKLRYTGSNITVYPA
jgi:hypothetical protein